MLSVVIPAFDEAERLPTTLQRLREWLDAAALAYEVIVVDDGSVDATAAVTEALRQGWPQLRLVGLGRNRGKGAAVRAGMLAAVGAQRLFSDADLSTPIEEYPRLRERLDAGFALVIASRALPESEIVVRQARRRELMGRTFNRLVRLIALGGLRDTQCGFKLFTAEAAVACFAPLRTRGFGFDVEVLLRARHRGLAIAEVPVRWRHVEASRVHPVHDSAAMLLELLLVRLRARRP